MNTLFKYFFAIIFVLTTCNFSYGQKQTKKVFLFAGQSNMEGRADADKISKEDFKRLEAVKNRITFYYNKAKATPLKITTPKKYVQKKFGLTNSFGPELFFGIELAEKYPNEEFIFIKRSQGGTSLYGCWNPDWTVAKATLMEEEEQPKLYYDFIELTHKVLDAMPKSAYQIAGMLWVQGEADSSKKRGVLPAETYGDNLENLIKSVRKEFEIKKMPFIMFQVGNTMVGEGMNSVANKDEQVVLIPQINNKKSEHYYPKNPAPLGHYVTESMKKIGTNFFKTYQIYFASTYLELKQ